MMSEGLNKADAASSVIAQMPMTQSVTEPIQGNWLSIEGAQTHCSVALQTDRATECFQLMYGSAKGHAEILPPMVDRILRAAELSPRALSGIVVCVGPGAFTGLRISVALAQGLAYAWQVPVISVPALAALAYAAAVPQISSEPTLQLGQYAPVQALCAFDARMGELYVGGYTLLPGPLPSAATDATAALPEARVSSQQLLAEQAYPSLMSQPVLRPWCAWLPDALLTPQSVLDTLKAKESVSLKEARVDESPVISRAHTLTLVGSGARYLGEDLSTDWGGGVVQVDQELCAADLIRLAAEQPHLTPVCDPLALAPRYLRHAVASPPARLQS